MEETLGPSGNTSGITSVNTSAEDTKEGSEPLPTQDLQIILMLQVQVYHIFLQNLDLYNYLPVFTMNRFFWA